MPGITDFRTPAGYIQLSSFRYECLPRFTKISYLALIGQFQLLQHLRLVEVEVLCLWQMIKVVKEMAENKVVKEMAEK